MLNVNWKRFKIDTKTSVRFQKTSALQKSGCMLQLIKRQVPHNEEIAKEKTKPFRRLRL